MAARSRLLSFLLLLCLCGCGLPDRSLKTKVNPPDVHGTWQLSRESLNLLQRDGFPADAHKSHRIEFLADGSLRYQSVLPEFKGGKYLDIPGEWSLAHDTTACSNIRVKNALQLTLHSLDTTIGTCLLFDKDKDAIVLWEFYGDPDSWEFLEYRKLCD
jgi:hypothetical protein